MFRFFLISAAAISVSFAQVSYYPTPDDTVKISFDTLFITGNSSASFNCKWTSALHQDSITWLIDGAAPSKSDVSIFYGPNPRDLPPQYSLGTELGILPKANPALFQGVHKIDLTVKFKDSTKTASWLFKYYPTKYRRIRAALTIDSSWTTNNNGWIDYIRYKITEAEKFDTALFGIYYRGDFSSIENDTTGIMRKYISQKTSASVIPKDTVDCFIIQILFGDSLKNKWIISDSVGSFLRITHAPFPLEEALNSFNKDINSHDIYRGYSPPSGDLKIGPVFKLSPGDPGWKVKAYNDSEFWYIDFQTGNGDCPAGCTESQSTSYRISASGTVSILPTAILNPVNRTRSTEQRSLDGQFIYNLQGRRAGGPECSHKLGKGTYIALNKAKKQLVTIIKD